MMSPRGEGVTGGPSEELAGAAGYKPPKRSPARPSRFHNFSFPTMSWGSQRILRCVNPVSAAKSTAPHAQIDPQNKRQASYSPDSPLPLPPHAIALKQKEETDQEEASSAGAEEAAAASAKPWNLRARRASCFAPSESERNRCPNPRLGKDDPENGKRREFSVCLSREEIEEDFYAFKGAKPNRRPKKRARIVQRQLDALFPGSWLSEVTADDYRVVE